MTQNVLDCLPVRPSFLSVVTVSTLMLGCGYLGVDAELSEEATNSASPPPPKSGGAGGADTATGGADTATGGADTATGGADTATGSTGGTTQGGSGGGVGEGGATPGSGGLQDGSGGEPGAGGSAETDPLIREDFEDGFSGIAITAEGARLELTSEMSHTGMTSLVATQGQVGEGSALQYDLTPILEGDLYFRGWVFIPQGIVSGRIKLLGFENGSSLLDVNATPGGRIDVYVQATDDRDTSAPNVHPYDEWFCLTAHYHAHPTEAFAEAFITENFVAGVAPQVIQGVNGIAAVEVGLSWTELGQTGGVVYWDDVAIGTAPIACEL